MKRGAKAAYRNDDWDIPSGRSPRKRKGLNGALRGRSLHRGSGAGKASGIDFGGLEPNSREAVVTVRYSNLSRPNAHAIAERHERYLQRDGKAEDGGVPLFYNRQHDSVDPGLATPLKGEKRMFRLVISPGDGDLLKMTNYVRQVMREIESDYGRNLIWSAVNHYNTDRPHAHVVVRGVGTKGREVKFSPEQVKHGMRIRARQIATRSLGPRLRQEMRAQYERGLCCVNDRAGVPVSVRVVAA